MYHRYLLTESVRLWNRVSLGKIQSGPNSLIGLLESSEIRETKDWITRLDQFITIAHDLVGSSPVRAQLLLKKVFKSPYATLLKSLWHNSRESCLICLFSLRYEKEFINTCYMTMLIHDNISQGKESVETPKALPLAREKFWTKPFITIWSTNHKQNKFIYDHTMDQLLNKSFFETLSINIFLEKILWFSEVQLKWQLNIFMRVLSAIKLILQT